MDFTLENFEGHVDSIIVDRGRNYWENGNVVTLTEVDENEWSAIVEGSDTYEVEIKISPKGEIIEYECDCPYDQGWVCKHIIAVLFEIKEELKNSIEMATNKTGKLTDNIDKILNQLTTVQLKTWLKKGLSKNPNLKNRFFDTFEHLISEE